MAAIAAVDDGTLPLRRRELYGGAMAISAPGDWMDTEAFMDFLEGRGAGRPFPDNQEIFMANGPGAGGKPPAIFIDLLEAAELRTDSEAPFFHAKEALERDGREEEAAALGEPAAVHEHNLVNLDAGKATAYSAAFPSADLHIGVVRLKGAATDCVISLHGATAAVGGEGSGPGGEGEGEGGGAGGPTKTTPCPSLVSLVDSLQVLDWGLFGVDAETEGS